MDLPLQKWTPEQTADKALRVLADRPYPLQTSDLAKYVAREVDPMSDALHDRNYLALREVLNRLYAAGKVNKRERSKAKHMWALSCDSWDKQDPFRPDGASAAPKPAYTREETQDEIVLREPEPVRPAHTATEDAVLGDALDRIRELQQWKQAANERLNDMNHRLADAGQTAAQLLKIAEAAQQTAKEALAAAPRELKVERYDGSTAVIPGGATLHPAFDKVKALAIRRKNILLIGPAGCGKTHLAETLADVLGLRFAALSCTAGMSEVHLLGRAGLKLQHDNAEPIKPGKGKKAPPYTPTEFVTCYEQGGVFLLDELDAADPNLLLCVNAALANGRLPLPNRGDAAVRHKDFVAVATANTYGRGATRVYAGRNQLDDATLDRFRVGTVEMDYDKDVERRLCPDDDLLQKVWNIRDKVMDTGMHRTISTRFLRDAYDMRTPDSEGNRWSVDECVRTLVAGWTRDELNKVGIHN